MTTLTMRTVPVHLEEDVSLQPLPWRRMTWVTWRQHRVALIGLAVLLSAIALYLWIQGRQMHHAYGLALACHPASSGACMNASDYFTNTYDLSRKITPLLLQAVPAIIGAFLGAPVLARELESGTFRYAWTQGFGRSRWTLAKLVSLGVLAAAAAELFSLLFSWYYQPFFADDQANSLAASAFNLRGITFAFWTLVAFAIGGFAGALMRRVVPALRCHPGHLCRARFGGWAVPASALLDAADCSPAEPDCRCVGDRRLGDEGWPNRVLVHRRTHAQRPRSVLSFRVDRQAVDGSRRGIRPLSQSPRLHALGQLPAARPVLALSVH